MTAAAAARKHSKRIAYVRVSSLDQNPERQLESISGESPDKTFTDKCHVQIKHFVQIIDMQSEPLREGDPALSSKCRGDQPSRLC